MSSMEGLNYFSEKEKKKDIVKDNEFIGMLPNESDSVPEGKLIPDCYPPQLQKYQLFISELRIID